MPEQKEKCLCAWGAWNAEIHYRDLVGSIEAEKADDARHYIKYFKKDLEKIQKDCGIDTSESVEHLKDAEWHLDRENWMDAKWDALWASAKALDELKKCAGIGREDGKESSKGT